VCALDIPIAGTTEYPDSYLQYAANNIANYLDVAQVGSGFTDDSYTNGKGKTVRDTIVASKTVLVGGYDKTAEEKCVGKVTPCMQMGTYKFKAYPQRNIKTALSEEAFNFIAKYGY
jgi:hypothetical protein